MILNTTVVGFCVSMVLTWIRELLVVGQIGREKASRTRSKKVFREFDLNLICLCPINKHDSFLAQ